MKRFLSKITMFFFIVSILTIGINFAYLERNHADPDYTNKFKDVPVSIKICNFGSSHGAFNFNYEDIKDTSTFNFALPSQYYSYDIRLFEYYSDHISKGAIVFIPVSYFELFGKDETQEDNFQSKNKRYYGILPPSLIKEYNFKTDLYAHYLPSLSAGEKLIPTLVHGVKNTQEEKWSQESKDIDIVKDAKAACKRHIITNKKDENGQRILNTKEIICKR